MAIIQARFENSAKLEIGNNYVNKASSAFIDNNINTKCYLTLIIKDTVHKRHSP